jgi:[protein-PII] uridylyltransferase
VEANIHTLRDHVFDVFKIISSAGTPVDYAEISTLQNQIKKDLRRVCVNQEPLSQVFKNRSLLLTQEQTKVQDIKLKVKLIGRSIKIETRDILGTFMTLTGVFSQFNMEVQRAVLDTREGTASNIFYMRPKDVRDIIENKEYFLHTLKNALKQLVCSGEVVFKESSTSINSAKPTLAI